MPLLSTGQAKRADPATGMQGHLARLRLQAATVTIVALCISTYQPTSYRSYFSNSVVHPGNQIVSTWWRMESSAMTLSFDVDFVFPEAQPTQTCEKLDHLIFNTHLPPRVLPESWFTCSQRIANRPSYSDPTITGAVTWQLVPETSRDRLST